MANQGLLAQLKPTGATDTVLYRAPIASSASTVLTVANDGTGAAYDVAVKDYDQKLTLDASTYLLHEGDVVSSYFVTLGTNMSPATNITPGQSLVTQDGEKSFKFESFYIPPFTTVGVKSVSIRAITVESVTGAFLIGETITKGSGGDTTTAVIYGIAGAVLYVGPSTINGSGAEFAAGDSISSTGNGAGTISVGGVGSATNSFTFANDGGTETYLTGGINLYGDRAYRFDTSDSSMSGRDFKLSTTENGVWGPDGTTGTGDDGTEFTTGKTTNGTAGSSGAYIQYDFTQTDVDFLYFYDGGTGTASNSEFGGEFIRVNLLDDNFPYPGFYIYDKEGTIVNNVDSFLLGGVTYTITGQTAGAYGYVKDYTGSTLKFIKGLNAADFSGTDTFRDVPKDNTGMPV